MHDARDDAPLKNNVLQFPSLMHAPPDRKPVPVWWVLIMLMMGAGLGVTIWALVTG